MTQPSAADTSMQAALQRCDDEPIHIPGIIQSFGALLASDLRGGVVTHASENLSDCLGTDVAGLGADLAQIIGDQGLHDVRNLLTMSTSRSQRARAGICQIGGTPFEIYAHANNQDRAIIELEPCPVQAPQPQIADQFRALLAKAGEARNIPQMLQICVRGLQAITQYDRVKAYVYHENGDGEVVAEAKTPQAPSYLGLRYPSWDVPKQARALQIKNPVRLINDVTAAPVGILSQDGQDLDLSLAHLRGTSPVHLQYLTNMGVEATLTIGLVVDGQLWGMFSCHHLSPKVLQSDLRILCEIFGQMVSLLIRQSLEIEKTAALARGAQARKAMLARVNDGSELFTAFTDLVPMLTDTVACDGLAIATEKAVKTHGSTPPEDTILALCQHRAGEVNLTDSTPSMLKDGWITDQDLGDSAGCLLVRSAAVYPVQLLFFRDAMPVKINWAGKPEKQIVDAPGGPRLTPRGSFELFEQINRDTAQPWQDQDKIASEQLTQMFVEIQAKADRYQLKSRGDQAREQRQKDILIAELNHRVRNILTLIQSLARQARKSSTTLEDYAQSLEARISALAIAHDLAVSQNLSGVFLRSLLEAELTPYLAADNPQVLMSGPDIGLRPDVAPMVALVMHEIVTNAVKHGALSTREGVVRITWTLEESELRLSWTEINGPPVQEPQSKGFGMSLVGNAITYEFQGHTEIDFAPTGVRFGLRFSSDLTVEMAPPEDRATYVGPVAEIEAPATGKTILLVEDNLVIAMDMVETLTEIGAADVKTAGSVVDGLKALEEHRFDCAILDMNLNGTVSFDLARQLRKRGLPFFFVTGYGSNVPLPKALSDVPILTKPVNKTDLGHMIDRLLTKA